MSIFSFNVALSLVFRCSFNSSKEMLFIFFECNTFLNSLINSKKLLSSNPYSVNFLNTETQTATFLGTNTSVKLSLQIFSILLKYWSIASKCSSVAFSFKNLLMSFAAFFQLLKKNVVITDSHTNLS